jgi:PEP-CTERM motif-containing protein
MTSTKLTQVKVPDRKIRFLFALAGIAVFLGWVPASMASPVGVLNITNCNGGGVTVTSTSVDWLLPVGGGNGCISSDSGTNVTYTGGGPLLSNDATGLIKDLPAGSNLDFMVFTDQPNLHFDLSSVGPGVVSTVCSTTLNPNNASCSVFAGSPFILTPTATGTTVTLSAAGIARDTTGSSNWLGSFTTQFPGITPAQLQAAETTNAPIPGFCSGGACTNTYSASFSVTLIPTPEPTTVSLIGLGLAGLALVKRHRAKQR